MTSATTMEFGGDCGPPALTRQQFEALYGHTAPALRSYVCRIAGNSALADDVLQESYIRLLVAPPMADEHRKR